MSATSVAGIIFANAYDNTLEKLTQKRSIASVLYGGRYRLVDFSLSNLVNAGITNVGIITKEKYRSLMDHIGSGIYWDLDRKSGGVRILPPFNISRARFYQNHIEALYGAMDFMVRCNAESIVLCDARTVANVDIESVLETHTANCADVTVVCYKGRETDNIDNTMVFNIEKDSRISLIGFPNKIAADDYRGMGIFVFNRQKLIELVKNTYENGGSTIGENIISENLDSLKVIAYKHCGYVAVMDSINQYRKSNFDLLKYEVRKDLFNEDRPIYTKTRDDMPTRYGTKSAVSNSLIGEGCIIEGTVKNSVLFRDVKIEKGAVVENSILMQSVTVGADTVVDNAVFDKNASVGEGMTVRGTAENAFFLEKNQKI